jgi:large subunit ribosomal protein L23
MKYITDVLVKPLITEKTNKSSEKLGQYSFIVDMKANKDQIKKAIEVMYNVSVAEISTLRMPGKDKTKFTNKGLSKGMKSNDFMRCS